jgi:hypothetical protein
MCDNDDIRELCELWISRDNYCKLVYDKGIVKHGYFSLDNRKNNNTHIHVFWNVNEEAFYYQLKCGGDHCGTNVMLDECDIEYYYALFKQLLNDCDPSVGCDRDGGRRKTRKRRWKKRSRKNQSKIYSHRSK